MQFRDAKSFPKMIGHVWLLQTMNFCVKEQPLISKEHSVNPIGSILVPVAVMMKGYLSFVSFSFKVHDPGSRNCAIFVCYVNSSELHL